MSVSIAKLSSTSLTSLTLGLGVLGAALSLGSCTEVECSSINYTRAECRVVAEHAAARYTNSQGVDVRYDDVEPLIVVHVSK